MPTATPYLAQLQKALIIAERIDAFEHELAGIMGEDGASALKAEVQPTAAKVSGKRVVSAEAKARMAAGQKARWAKKGARASEVEKKETNVMKIAGLAAEVGRLAKKKRAMSPEAKARIGAAMKARWAAKKKGGKASNARKGK